MCCRFNGHLPGWLAYLKAINQNFAFRNKNTKNHIKIGISTFFPGKRFYRSFFLSFKYILHDYRLFRHLQVSDTEFRMKDTIAYTQLDWLVWSLVDIFHCPAGVWFFFLSQNVPMINSISIWLASTEVKRARTHSHEVSVRMVN